MNPPVRDARHRDRIWKALADGVVDVLGSDHAPHTREGKGPCLSGLPLGHDRTCIVARAHHARPHVNAGRLSLQRPRRSDEPRPPTTVWNSRQGPHRRRLGSRPDLGRFETPAKRSGQLDRKPRRLDALRRKRRSRAGRWERSCAAAASCGRASSVKSGFGEPVRFYDCVTIGTG